MAEAGHSGGTVDGFPPYVRHEGRPWNWKRMRMRRGAGAEGGMREGGICVKKASNDLLQGTEVCYPTYSEGLRYQAREDQHQGPEEGS